MSCEPWHVWDWPRLWWIGRHQLPLPLPRKRLPSQKNLASSPHGNPSRDSEFSVHGLIKMWERRWELRRTDSRTDSLAHSQASLPFIPHLKFLEIKLSWWSLSTCENSLGFGGVAEQMWCFSAYRCPRVTQFCLSTACSRLCPPYQVKLHLTITPLCVLLVLCLEDHPALIECMRFTVSCKRVWNPLDMPGLGVGAAPSFALLSRTLPRLFSGQSQTFQASKMFEKYHEIKGGNRSPKKSVPESKPRLRS